MKTKVTTDGDHSNVMETDELRASEGLSTHGKMKKKKDFLKRWSGVVTTLKKQRKTEPRKNTTRDVEQHVDDPAPVQFIEEEEKDAHAALLNSVLTLDGSKPMIEQRSGTDGVSEFASEKNLEDTGGSIELSKLVLPINSIGTKMRSLVSGLGATEGSRKLRSAEKTVLKKIERKNAYKETSEVVNKWQSIVLDNRKPGAVQHFPLQEARVSMEQTSKEITLAFKPRNQMEAEIQMLLKGPNYNAADDPSLKAVVTQQELRQQKAMSLAEVQEGRHVLRMQRLRDSYVASKCKQIKKIKSKTYRKHLKLQRTKGEYIKMEALRKSDPETWKVKAEEIERARIEERMTQRHKVNKFAKKAQQFGKFNEKIRDSLAEMHAKASQLRRKQRVESSDSEYSEDEPEPDGVDEVITTDANNPWIAAGSKQKEVPSKAVSLIKPKPVVVPLVQEKPKPAPLIEVPNVAASQPEEYENPVESTEGGEINLEVPMRLSTLEDVDSFDAEFVSNPDAEINAILPPTADERIQTFRENCANDAIIGAKATGRRGTGKPSKKNLNKAESEDIDINKVMKAVPTVTVVVDDSDQKEANKMNIAEAFVDDNIVEEFERRREELYIGDGKRKLVEDTNIVPGWGHWGGDGVAIPQYKRQKVEIARQKRLQELNNELSVKIRKHPTAIINHQAIQNLPIAKYQVRTRDLTSATDRQRLENKMATPLGRDWVPESQHRVLIKPNTTFTPGAIIHPMDKNMVMEDQKKSQCKFRPIYTKQYKVKDPSIGQPKSRRKATEISSKLIKAANKLF